MECAPIIIPTLNRRTHLERCLQSLAKNKYAKDSDLIISVDYPPNNDYMKGYEEVVDFLSINDWLEQSFRKVNIIFQKENLGPLNNITFLYGCVRQYTDRCILTEDDNEFSANFLEYINKGLKLFENDEKIIGICGCKDTDFICPNDENVLASKLFSAYGVGMWLEKNNRLDQIITSFLLDKETYSKRNLKSLKKNDRVLYNIYLTKILMGNKKLYWDNGKLNSIDSVKSIYMHLSDTFCVVPKVAKSRTWGNDGSGQNMKKITIDPEKEWPLDVNNDFDFQLNNLNNGSSLIFNPANYAIGNDYMNRSNSFKYNLKADIYYFLLLLYKFDRKKAKEKAIKFFGN